jgi:hypothetical protein
MTLLHCLRYQVASSSRFPLYLYFLCCLSIASLDIAALYITPRASLFASYSFGASCKAFGTMLVRDAITAGATASVGPLLTTGGTSLLLSGNRICSYCRTDQASAENCCDFNAPDVLLPVNMRTAGRYAVMGSAAISNTGSDTNGGTDQYDPTDEESVQAKEDLLLARQDAGGREVSVGAEYVLAATLDSLILAPGVYDAAGAIGLAASGTLTFDAQGDPNAVWIIRASGALTTGASATFVRCFSLRWGVCFVRVSSLLGGMGPYDFCCVSSVWGRTIFCTCYFSLRRCGRMICTVTSLSDGVWAYVLYVTSLSDGVVVGYAQWGQPRQHIFPSCR